MNSHRNGHHHPDFQPFQDNEIQNYEEHFLTDELDHKILMHRDAHFGGDFGVMLSYYQNENRVGVDPEIDYDRIAYLSQVEHGLGQDLAPLILSGPEAETVARARQAYQKLKEVYESDEGSSLRLIADLILSEEEEPEREIEAIVEAGQQLAPELIAILRSDDAYDPLFPGYGFAPYLAMICLGKIGDASAIVPIFETLSKPLVFDEMGVVESLSEIGAPAKDFLLKILVSRPLTQDNVNAAFALIAFADEPSVAVACFEELKKPEVAEKPLLRAYLLNNCDLLKSTNYRGEFAQMAEDPRTLPELRKEMRKILEDW